MKRRSASAVAALAAASACVSFDPSARQAPDITGTYAVMIVTSIANAGETRSDTFAATLELRPTQDVAGFAGRYRIAGVDSGPVAGEFMSRKGDLLVTAFGAPPKPIAGVGYVRDLYPQCDFPLLGVSPLRGALSSDSLNVTALGSVPCTYDPGDGPASMYTEFSFLLRGSR